MGGIDPNIAALLGIAIINAIISWRTHASIKVTQADVLRVEKATNSMKDALVARTAEAAEAKGRDDERAVGEAKAAVLAQGILDGTKKV